MTKEQILYLRTLLDYAEGFDGFYIRLDEAFGAKNLSEEAYDAHCERMGRLSSEVWDLLAIEEDDGILYVTDEKGNVTKA